MWIDGPTDSPAISEAPGSGDRTLSQVVPKPPDSSPKKASLKRKYDLLVNEDLRGK